MRYFGAGNDPIVADGIMYVTGQSRLWRWIRSQPEIWDIRVRVVPNSLETRLCVRTVAWRPRRTKYFMATYNAHLIP